MKEIKLEKRTPEERIKYLEDKNLELIVKNKELKEENRKFIEKKRRNN